MPRYLVSLALPLLLLSSCCLHGESSLPSYVDFLHDYSRTYDCRCHTVSSEYDFLCEIVKKGLTAANSSISCSNLPTKVIAHLNISCSGCSNCVSVNMHEMTRAHYDDDQQINFYPPSEISLNDCRVNSLNIRMMQLRAENVSVTEGMEIAQFGVPQHPGVGGYYTVNVTYPTDFNASDCWLTYLHIRRSSMWYLPAYVLHKCQYIRSVSIVESPITWVSMTDLLALRSIDSLTLRNCSVRTFADDALSKALTALDEYLQRVGPQPVTENPQVAEAIKRLRKMRQDSGKLNLVINLYDMMDSFNISFSLLFGYRTISLGSGFSPSDIPFDVALSYLNLQYNELTEIPFSISMFGNLNAIDLSHNKIRRLYHSWLCWYPPIREEDKANSTRHCYWFRGSRQTLKVLNLSYNRIKQIGEIQPWHGVALAELYLQNNFIVSINSDAFSYSLLSKSLLALNLDDNQLPYIHLKCLSRLETLSIRNGGLANIELSSIPQSERLRWINLTNNSISSISYNAFNNRPALETIDLRNNSLENMYAYSFNMSERPTLSSRVVLLISGQKVKTVCNCYHVYAYITEEETDLERTNYHYPAIPKHELEITSCLFFLKDGANSTRKLSGASYREFLCLTNSTFECWETCVPDCSCYHTAKWELSDLNCTNIDVNMVSILLRIPVKYMYFSGIRESDYFHRITNSTLKWETPKLRDALVVLFFNNSNIRYIEENAFVDKTSIKFLYLDDNRLEKVPAKAFCSPNSDLIRLSLLRNNLTWIDPYLLNSSCLPNLNELKISSNPWHCQCNEMWTSLHKSLISVARTTQVVPDFESMRCQVDPAIIEACELNRWNDAWRLDCQKILLSNGSRDYPVSDEGGLVRIVLIILSSLFGLALLGFAVLAVRRRHRLLAVVRVLILLKYQSSRRLQQQTSRDSLPYDAMLWASDRDQDCLVDVLNCVRSASGGDELELCVPESFLYSDLCSCPLTYFDCPAEGAKFSGKVVVALSERFLDTQYLALCQVIRDLDSLGRNPFKDIVFLRLSSRRVSLQRQRQLGPEDVEAFHTLQRILAGSDIEYKSVDWEYRLIERIRNRDPAAVLVFDSSVPPETSAAATPAVADRLDITVGTASEPEELLDLPGEGQPLIVDVEQTIDFIRSRTILSTIRDWPPFHSDKVPEVFILSAPESASDSESRADPDSSSNTVVELIVRRLQGVRLGTNDAALAARWPDNFEGASPAGRINSFLMKRTRQFVLLLSNGLLSWLRDEAELQCEFQAFLAANSFRRRLLVVQVGQVDSRSRARYRALANQRLDGGESGPATNWFDMSADDRNVEALGLWLDGVLYKK
uniref:TIR domain-containing protein n=1 Tax=Macrostomum lignano TaxID=282301 RepID=A0A1I8HAC1_9PLAT